MHFIFLILYKVEKRSQAFLVILVFFGPCSLLQPQTKSKIYPTLTTMMFDITHLDGKESKFKFYSYFLYCDLSLFSFFFFMLFSYAKHIYSFYLIISIINFSIFHSTKHILSYLLVSYDVWWWNQMEKKVHQNGRWKIKKTGEMKSLSWE